MSASSKKKLRNEQQAAKMTERQLAEQKEAKKLKLYTTAFVVVLVALLVAAVAFGVSNVMSKNGSRERNTVAMTVGTHDISNVEMNYYFIDSLNSMYSGEYGYLMQMGLLDSTVPLDQQSCYFSDSNQTWAQYLMDVATKNATSTYALKDAAAAAGYTMPEAYLASVDSTVDSRIAEAASYGYDVDSYLKAVYGNGSSLKSYRAYVEDSVLAQAYYYEHARGMNFDDAQLRELEAEDYNAYTSYSYNYYYVNASSFLQGGTQDENGTVTYSDEEKAAAVAAAEEAAKQLTAEEIDSIKALDLAIGGLSINEGTEAASTVCEDQLYTGITVTQIGQWLAGSEHTEGDKVYLANETTTDGVTTVNGYYVVYYVGADENLRPMNSVRHILVSFQGGTQDENGTVTYSDEEKAAALADAEALLAEWKAGEATEDSFAALANEKSADGDGTTGGLYKYVGLNSGYVEPFEQWAADEARQVGDTEIVETQYGYHIMYFVGNTGRTYRDVLIENQLITVAMDEWYTQQVEAVTVTMGDTSYVATDLVLSGY